MNKETLDFGVGLGRCDGSVRGPWRPAGLRPLRLRLLHRQRRRPPREAPRRRPPPRRGASETTATTAATGPATGTPIKLGFDEGFTGFMAYDCQQADEGIKTALAMINNQWMGHPVSTSLRIRLRPGRRRRQSSEAGGERQNQRDDRPDLFACSEGGGRLSGQVLRHPGDDHRRAAGRQPDYGERPGVHPDRHLRCARVLLRQVPRRRKASRPRTSSTTTTPQRMP